MNSNGFSENIGVLISQLREAKGETQQALADSLGVKRETVNQWENGTRQIKAEAIKSLAQHFNTSADFLLGLTNASTDNKNLQFVCDYTGLSEDAILELLHAKRNFPKGNSGNGVANDFISYYFLSLMHYLSRIQESAERAKEAIAQSKKDFPDLKAFKGNVWDIIDPLNAVEESLEISLFRFSKICNDIPDYLYDTETLASEIDEYRETILSSRLERNYVYGVEEIDDHGDIVFVPLDTQHGKHQED